MRWADDTPEKLRASLRAEQGDEMAAFLDAFIRGEGPEPQRRRQVPKRVGRKPRNVAIPMTRGTSGMTSGEASQAGAYVREKNHLRTALRRAVSRFGEDSDQARTAAAALRAFVEKP